MEEASAWMIPSSILFLLFIFLFLSIFKLTLNSRNAKSTNFPPSPPSLPIIGHLHHLIKQPLHQSLHKLTEEYGHVILLQLGTRKLLVVSSPAAVEECFTKNDIVFANRPHTLAAKHLGYNKKTMASAPYDDHWRSLRRLTNLELFSANRLAEFSKVREEEVQLFVKQLFRESRKNTMLKVELRPRFIELSFNMMLRMISGKRYYGKDAVAKEGEEFQILMKEFLKLHGSGRLNDFFPILQLVDFRGIEKKMVKLMKKMDDFFQRLLDDHQRNRGMVDGKGIENNVTLIDVMLDLQQKEPHFYTDETVKAVILQMLVAGTETSANTMEWALSLLLNNPETMNKLRFEIDTCAEHDHLLSESDTTKLKYLQNIIIETLRLYPVVPFLTPHESSTDCKVCGFDIPKGTMLLANLWTLHRDPNFWVDPTRFVPERFGEGEGDGGEGYYNMIPFGAGRRACPGAVLAKRSMGHVLGILIQCFEWDKINENKEMDMQEEVGITMPKAEPLVAFCRPRQEMIEVLSNI